MVIYKANYGMICVMKEKEIIVNIKKEINDLLYNLSIGE